MKNSIKTYFKDYVEAQKVCNEFNKKHWKGSLLLSSVIGIGTFLALGGGAAIKDMIDDKIQKRKSNDDNDV